MKVIRIGTMSTTAPPLQGGQIDKNGKIVSVDPRDVPNPVVPIMEIRWEDFRELLMYGQLYE